VVSFDCGRIIRHPPIKTDSDAILSSGPTERQRIGDEIDAAFIFAQVDFVNVQSLIASVMRHSTTKSC